MFCGLLAQQIFKLFFIFTLLQSQSWSSILWFKYTPAFCIGNLGRQRWGISSDWSWYVPQINSKWNFLLICLEYRHRGCYGKNTLCFPILVNWMFRIGNPPPNIADTFWCWYRTSEISGKTKHNICKYKNGRSIFIGFTTKWYGPQPLLQTVIFSFLLMVLHGIMQMVMMRLLLWSSWKAQHSAMSKPGTG